MFTAAQNPFRTSRLHNLDYSLDGVSWEGLLARLESMNHRAAIIGNHGTGKTTLLEAIGDRLEERGIPTVRLFLNTSQQTLPPNVFNSVPQQAVVLLDGAEQLNWLAWRGLLKRTRRMKGIIITCHRPMRLPVLYACVTSHALLNRLLDELLPGIAAEHRDAAHVLFDRHQGNLREVFFSLYNQFIVST